VLTDRNSGHQINHGSDFFGGKSGKTQKNIFFAKVNKHIIKLEPFASKYATGIEIEIEGKIERDKHTDRQKCRCRNVP